VQLNRGVQDSVISAGPRIHGTVPSTMLLRAVFFEISECEYDDKTGAEAER
jgi:hypothetical protein